MRLVSAVTAVLVACIPSAFALPTKHDTSNEVTEEGMPVRSLDETLAMTIDTLAVEADGSVSSENFQTFQVVDEINDELTMSATDKKMKAKTSKESKLTKGTKQPKIGTKSPKSSKCTKLKGMLKVPKIPKGATHPPGESDYALMRVTLKGSNDCSEIQSFFEENLCIDFNIVECNSSSDSLESSSVLSRNLDAADGSFKSSSVLLQVFDATAESLSEYIEKNEKSLNKLWMKKLDIEKGSKKGKGGVDVHFLSIEDVFSTMIPSSVPSDIPSDIPSELPSTSCRDVGDIEFAAPISPTSFNAIGQQICFTLKDNSQFKIPAEIITKVNGATVTTSLSPNKKEMCVDSLSTPDGPLDLNFEVGPECQESPSLLSAVIVSGEATGTISVVNELGQPLGQPATVNAISGDNGLVTETFTQSNASDAISFSNLPERTILFNVVANDGSCSGTGAIDVSDSFNIELTCKGFNLPSTIDNNDFSGGLEGWSYDNSSPSTVVNVVEHKESPGPPIEISEPTFSFPLNGNFVKPAVFNTASPEKRMEKSPAFSFTLPDQAESISDDQDLVVNTGGVEGETTVSRTFQASPDAYGIRVRYRFVTSEVPGGYFGTQYNDYFAVTIRSQNEGGLITEQDTMNNLGLSAFDYDTGETNWREAVLPLQSGGDIVQVDVTVANVGDELYDSQVYVDFIEVLTESSESFNIKLVNTGTNTDYDDAFAIAKARWESILRLTILPKVVGSEVGVNDWFYGQLPKTYNGTTSDVVIGYNIGPIDGAGNGVTNTLGFASTLYTRGENAPPFSGIMVFDEYDFNNMPADNAQLILLHEMGHVLGLVNTLGTCSANCGTNGNYNYNCPLAKAEYDELTFAGKTSLMLENDGGEGTACKHWEEDSFPESTGSSELMTGTFEEDIAQPLSKVSIASLDDMFDEYIVDYSQADPYPVPAGGATEESSSTLTHKIWTPKTTFSLDGMVDDIEKLKEAMNGKKN